MNTVIKQQTFSIKPRVTFVHKPGPMLLDLESETQETGERVYRSPAFLDEAGYPSITTLLNWDPEKQLSLQRWRDLVGEEAALKIRNEAQKRGTRMHTYAEHLLENKEFAVANVFDYDLFNQVRPILEKHVNNIYCIESTLYSNYLRLAGRVDLIAEWDSTPVVIDFKTSTKEKMPHLVMDYFLQTCAYAVMYEECTGVKIPEVRIIMAVRDSNKAQVFEHKVETLLPQLVERINAYRQAKGQLPVAK